MPKLFFNPESFADMLQISTNSIMIYPHLLCLCLFMDSHEYSSGNNYIAVFRLPNAPDVEIYCLYGVGIPTERSYVYKMSPSDRCKRIPFRIDNSAYGSDHVGLKGGVYFVDGDETVPVLSAGFMCAKGWRGKTRFNPSGSATYVREYQHKPPASLFEGSGGHVDIMGNVALIEDVLRVAAGATGAELGGDRIYSDLLRMSERVNIRL